MFSSCIRTSLAFGNRNGILRPTFVYLSRKEPMSSSGTSLFKDGLKSPQEVEEFLGKLSETQKQLLLDSLNLEGLRKKYQDELGQYLSKFGRPSAHPVEDPTGTLCEVSPQWLHTRLALTPDVPQHDVPLENEDLKKRKVTGSDIWAVGLKNCLPFIGFGFLDNLIMILAGDYIDLKIGTALGISTMAAAALGNTISDVAGIASAWYVEMFSEKVGIKEPNLTAVQWSSWQIRWATTSGRAIGVIIGCLLGMIPLFFLPSAEEKKERGKHKKEQQNS